MTILGKMFQASGYGGLKSPGPEQTGLVAIKSSGRWHETSPEDIIREGEKTANFANVVAGE
jgi:hypothetical protein